MPRAEGLQTSEEHATTPKVGEEGRGGGGRDKEEKDEKDEEDEEEEEEEKEERPWLAAPSLTNDLTSTHRTALTNLP